MTVTLVGTAFARVGEEFVYTGPTQECRDCRIKTVCFNLQAGKRYRITALRDRIHECRLNGGTARIVEVEMIPGRVVMPTRTAIEGSTITFEPSRCRRTDCPYHHKCNPVAVPKGTKMKIIRVVEKVECAIGRSLVETETL